LEPRDSLTALNYIFLIHWSGCGHLVALSKTATTITLLHTPYLRYRLLTS